MDPLTHALSGAVMARAAPGEKLPWGSVGLLALMAMAPDADYVLRLFSDIAYLKYHRGLSHSILLLPLWIWLCYSIIPKQRRKNPVMPWLIAAVLGLHIFLDVITSYGTMLLSPFTDQRFTLDLVFIIDPLLTLTLLIPLLLMYAWPKHAQQLCITGLLSMLLYLCLTYSNQKQALDILQREQPRAEYHSALPLPFSPFRWQLIATYHDHYQRAAVDLQPAFQGSSPLFPKEFTQRLSGLIQTPAGIKWQQLASMTSIQDIDKLPGVNFYKWFARFPVVLQKNDELLEFADLRFYTGRLEDSHFRLELNMADSPEAWLIWSEKLRGPVGMEKGLSASW
ncbi:MAG: metal-dependent hydrolase [Mariprofundaceae bacterium]